MFVSSDLNSRMPVQSSVAIDPLDYRVGQIGEMRLNPLA